MGLGLAGAAAIVVSTFAAFSVGLDGQWLGWDDVENFVNNPSYRGHGLAPLRWAWTEALHGVYQPLSWMWLNAQWRLFGLDVRGYHWVSLVLHAANGVLLARLSLDLMRRSAATRAPGSLQRASATLGALSFVVHPLRAEVVAWVSAQPYLLSACFALQATRLYLAAGDAPLDHRRRRRRRIGAFAFYLAAALAKAPALGLPVVLALIEWMRWRRSPERVKPMRLWGWLPYAIGAMGTAGIAWFARQARSPSPSLTELPLASRVMEATYAAGFYLSKTLWPAELAPHYPRSLAQLSASNLDPVAHFAVFLLLGTAAIALRREAVALLISFGAYLVCLAPNLGIVHVSRHICADRYSYLACLGWSICLSLWLARTQPARAPSRLAGIALLISVAGVLAFRQTRVWGNDLALWNQTTAPDGRGNAVALNQLGVSQALNGQAEAAMKSFRRAMDLEPSLADCRANLGALLLSRGKTPEGVELLQQALTLQSDNRIALLNLGIYQLHRNELGAATNLLTAAVKADPTNPRARLALAEALLESEAFDEAKRQAEAALRIDADLAQAKEVLEKLGRSQRKH